MKRVGDQIVVQPRASAIAVLLLHHCCDKPAVATGPLKFELASLEHARKVFNNSHPEEAM